MADENIVNGKLLIVNGNDGNYPGDYKYTMPENTKSDMYYSYIEAIIPTDRIQAFDSNECFQITFGTDLRTLVNITGYDNTSGTNHISIVITADSGLVRPEITNIDEINSLFSNEYVVVSFMILPKLNKNPLITTDSVFTNSLAIFINGIQLVFYYSNTTIPILPLFGMQYDPDESTKDAYIRNAYVPSGSYIIFNTEYERFIYKNLANMCYSANEKQSIEVNDIKKDLISSTGSDIVYRSSWPFPHNTKFTNNWQYLKFNSSFLATDSRPIKFYMEIEIPTELYNKLDDLTGVSLSLHLAQLKYDALNIIDQANSVYSTRYDENSFGWEEEDELGTQRSDYTWYDYIGNGFSSITVPSERPKDYLYIIYMIALNNGSLHEYYGIQNLNRDEYDIVVDLEDAGTISILETDKCFPYFSMESGGSDVYDFSFNMGEDKFHTIPSIFNDKSSNGFNQLYRSNENAHWKSLWKYGRTLEFTTYLQDNPALFPLNIFRNMNENMFIEINMSEIGDSEWAIGSGFNFYDNTDNTISRPIKDGFYCKSVWGKNINKYENGTSVDVFDYEQYNRLALWYNAKTKKLKFLQNDIYNKVAAIKEYDITSDDQLNKFTTVMLHIYPSGDIGNTANFNLGSMSINFGPTSDYFQDYIDELLKDDEYKEIQYFKQNIFKNHNYHTTQASPYFGYDMDNDIIAGYDKGVWK